ncbi:hypothetical protein COV16_07040 [Candidatus Woesearchaeota archaeon CG10_big_fil_rev_8_21_14_0_10_34_8]|nr:MAG: hypothetical protein COV16_07040 [Candidatus Woesearchaeota archaeon CG10_big_fil_rev_8_21_14_0_10_34_8]
MYDKYFNLAAERKISQKQAWVLALKELSIPTSWKEVRKIHYSFFKVNMPAILCLQSYDCRMLLLSKNTRSQFADTEKKIMFKQHFDRVINTWELKLPKADKKTIHYICRTEHCKPREIVMIDDQASNLIAAKKMGVKTVHFRNIKQCKRELDAIFG